MEGRSLIADSDRARIGVGGDLEIIFEPVTRRNEHQVDARIDPRVADPLKMRGGSPSLPRSEVIDGLAWSGDFSARFRSQASARKADVGGACRALVSSALKDR